MKAAVLTGAEQIEVQELSIPEIGEDEVLVKIEACGICGTDLHAYRHEGLYPPGTIIGHECSGIVHALGSAVENYKGGDRVVVFPAPSCGECAYCLTGLDNACEQAMTRDIGSTPERPGGCATYVRIKWPEKALYHLPDSMNYKQGALVEPLATSYHAVQQSKIQAGGTAVVLGAGPIGLGIIQFLKIAGASKIIIVEISPERSQLALDLGADITINPITEGDKLTDTIIEAADGLGANVVYECTGVQIVFQKTLEYVRNGGQIMAIGVIEKDTPINPLTLIIKEAELRGSMCYTGKEFQEVIDLIADGKVNTDLMITDTIALEDIEEKGMRQLMTSSSAIKTLVIP